MNRKLLELIESLTAATTDRKVTWEFVISNVFRAKVGKGLVTVSRDDFQLHEDSPIMYVVRVRITDAHARVVEDMEIRENTEDYPLANQLFETVRRSAFNSEQTIDDMLEAIGGR